MKTTEQILQNIEEDGVYISGRVLNPVMDLFQIELVFPETKSFIINNILKRLDSKPEFFVVESCMPEKSCSSCNKKKPVDKNSNKSLFIDFTIKFVYNTIDDIKNKFVELFNLSFDSNVKDTVIPNSEDIIVPYDNNGYCPENIIKEKYSSFITNIKNLLPGLAILFYILILVCYFIIKYNI